MSRHLSRSVLLVTVFLLSSICVEMFQYNPNSILSHKPRVYTDNAPLNNTPQYKSTRLSQTLIDLPSGEFDKVVVQSTVPVVVDFSANWCGPCKLMLPIFKALAEEYDENVVKLVKVDTDIHEEAVERYNIQGVPMFGVFKNGELVTSYSGAMTKDKLREFINKNTQNDVSV